MIQMTNPPPQKVEKSRLERELELPTGFKKRTLSHKMQLKIKLYSTLMWSHPKLQGCSLRRLQECQPLLGFPLPRQVRAKQTILKCYKMDRVERFSPNSMLFHFILNNLGMALQTPQHEHSGQYENMGYDPAGQGHQTPNPNMENMGWDNNPTSVGPPSVGAPTTPYGDDEFDRYSMGPQSVRDASGNFQEDERGEDETQEEYEDRVLNKRAAHLNNILKNKLTDDDQSLTLLAMTRRNTRKQVAQKFYSLLVLQKVMAVELQQAKCYSEVTVSRGPKFDSAVL